eukprot:9354745-Pyramimonas_sp.AAC.1
MRGPSRSAKVAPNSRRKQVGNCSCRMSIGNSAPGLFPIHARRCTEGPSTAAMSCGLWSATYR